VARPRGAKARAVAVVELLKELYPDAQCALKHTNAFELLSATILSAQSTDERVNMVTPALFARYPTPADLAQADPDDVEKLIHSTGFFRAKTRSLIGMAQALDERFNGEVPVELDDLVTVPGVGRKTGNVVRSVWFGEPGLPVDTHVTRLSHLLKLTSETDPVKIEKDLGGMVPPEEWGKLSLRLIEHGRQVCIARRPKCGECGLAEICPSAGRVG
jgi:endonuclease-3